jgi:hypothetical protein
MQVQAQLRVVAQPGAERRPDVVGHAQRRGQAQFAAGRVAGGRQFGLGFAGGIQQPCAGGVVTATHVGQRQLPGRPVQQRHAGLALQRAHLLADRRGAHAQRARRRAHGAVLDHLREQRHAPEILHRPLLSASRREAWLQGDCGPRRLPPSPGREDTGGLFPREESP